MVDVSLIGSICHLMLRFAGCKGSSIHTLSGSSTTVANQITPDAPNITQGLNRKFFNFFNAAVLSLINPQKG